MPHLHQNIRFKTCRSSGNEIFKNILDEICNEFAFIQADGMNFPEIICESRKNKIETKKKQPVDTFILHLIYFSLTRTHT